MPTIDALNKTLPLDKPLRALIEAAPMMPIDRGSIHQPTVQALEAWLADEPLAKQTCLAGLWLLAGDLDRAHSICQAIDTAEGYYWHSIVHRREGDFSNSRYWIKQMDWHPVCRQLLNRHFDYDGPPGFIDWIERGFNGLGSIIYMEKVQWLEWQLLFQYCWTKAEQ